MLARLLRRDSVAKQGQGARGKGQGAFRKSNSFIYLIDSY